MLAYFVQSLSKKCCVSTASDLCQMLGYKDEKDEVPILKMLMVP
jgi:hypothetical protein